MNTLSIIIVENDSVQAHGLKNQLQELGFTVPAIARTKKEAFSEVKIHLPDIVIMDIELDGGKPGNVDGIKAAEKIHQEFETPIIYLSQYGDLDTYKKSKKNLAAYYVEKPISILNVLNSIDQIIKELEESPKSKKPKMSDRIFVKNGTGYYTIYLKDINFIMADREVSKIHYLNQKKPATVSLNIGNLETKLASFEYFVRCERSHIVNLKNVTRMTDKVIEDERSGKKKTKRFLEVQGELIPIGNHYKNAVKAKIHIF